MDEIDAFIDGIRAESQARVAIRLAAMRLAGLEPSPEDFTLLGAPPFSISYRIDGDGQAEVRLTVRDDHVWGLPYPDRGAFFRMPDLLDAIVETWPVVGRSHTRGRDPVPGRTVLAPTPARGERDLLLVIHDGKGLVLGHGEARHPFGRESVIVAQALMSMADVLAAELGPDHPSSEAWAGIRPDVDLPPCAGEGEHAPDTFREETLWSASKAGLPVETYCLAAVDVLARQVLSAKDRSIPEPDRSEWVPSHVPSGMRAESVMTRAAEAAAILNLSGEDFEAQAVSSRNSDVFQSVFYPG